MAADDTNNPLSTLPADVKTVAKSLGADIAAPPERKYSYMSSDVAKGLTPDNIKMYDGLEDSLAQSRRYLNNGEAANFNALANGDIDSNEFEQNMRAIDKRWKDPQNGALKYEAELRESQTTASRAVEAVREVSQKMGVEPPLVETRYDEAGIRADINDEGRNIVNLPQEKTRILTPEELRFAVGHEIAHGTLNHIEDEGRKARIQEFEADAVALRATGNLEAAFSVLSKLSALSQQPEDRMSITHPSVKARKEKMREIYESELQKPSPTPADPAENTPKLPPR